MIDPSCFVIVKTCFNLLCYNFSEIKAAVDTLYLYLIGSFLLECSEESFSGEEVQLVHNWKSKFPMFGYLILKGQGDFDTAVELFTVVFRFLTEREVKGLNVFVDKRIYDFFFDKAFFVEYLRCDSFRFKSKN